MALNPYTLNHLYEKGILEYVPTDLGVNIPMGTLNTPTNPYFDMAKQGGLYQSAINGNDTFTHGVNNFVAYGANGANITTPQIGSQSNTGGLNTFLGYNVGTQSNNTTANTLGFGNGIGEQYQGGGLNIFGGFTDTQNGIRNGFNKTAQIINNTPRFILGLLAGAIGIGGIMMAFKKGKKPAKTPHTSFLSKLNPINWFKKNKHIK